MTVHLFEPTAIGTLNLPNRIVMAPMTRSRATQPGDVPNAMMAEYYAQRASAGMIITEATQISPEGKGYSFTPGIHSEEQVAGWKLVTDAVHAAGGRIVLQLWHVGRMSHESFHPDGKPVAPSAIAPGAQVWIADPETGKGGMVDCPMPRALLMEEIARVIDDYRKAAENAKAAGFDGVEIHAANGYLIDEFLRSTSNHRTDRYGGSVENRIRFAVEVAETVSEVMGADRTGFRFSPFITQRGMDDAEAPATILTLARELDRIGLAYIHLAEADWDDAVDLATSDAPATDFAAVADTTADALAEQASLAQDRFDRADDALGLLRIVVVLAGLAIAALGAIGYGQRLREYR